MKTEQKQFLIEFKDAKGPDFISRLRGYVNILGPNQTDDKVGSIIYCSQGNVIAFSSRKKNTAFIRWTW